MSFDFGSSNIPPFKAHSAYKDGGGMGGGGMYMNQGKNKRKDQPEEDLFEFKNKDEENVFISEKELSEEDIHQDNLFNKFVNWFRKNP